MVNFIIPPFVFVDVKLTVNIKGVNISNIELEEDAYIFKLAESALLSALLSELLSESDIYYITYIK